jgi:NADH-ubiquinone oxidoreductase chain 4
MIKLLLGVRFLVLITFYKKSWWILKSWIRILTFLVIFETPIYGIFRNLGIRIGLDILSYSLVILRGWIVILIILASGQILFYNNYSKYFLLINIFLLIALISAFSTINIIIFYIRFEISLIPTLLLILGWGYQPERLQAGIYIIIYTLIASLPLLIGIFYIYYSLKSSNIWILWKIHEINRIYLYFRITLAFLVKSPIFLVHLWLPKAHVEAPVSGSIILAGVLLKLGGYGLIRILKSVIILNLKLNYLWISIRLIGGFIVRLICLRQRDLKILVAYSSVAHISLAIVGITSITIWGMMGGLVLIIGHGLCSSCLFSLVNIIYERSGSRRIFLNQGFLNIIPSMALWWFLFRACNIAAPPSLNLLGEVGLLIRIINWSTLSFLILILISFFSAAYCYYLYAYSQHGQLYASNYACYSGEVREYLLIILHWIPLNFLILKRDWLFLSLYLSSLKKIIACGAIDIKVYLKSLKD